MLLKNELVAFSCSFCPSAGVQNVGKVENESSCSMLTCCILSVGYIALSHPAYLGRHDIIHKIK